MDDELRDAAFAIPNEHANYASELQRRIAEIDAGTARLTPLDEAISGVRRALKNARERSRQR